MRYSGQIQDVWVACPHPIRERSGGWRRVSCDSGRRNPESFLRERGVEQGTRYND